MFVEKEEVSYKEMDGIVDFICSSYIVIQLPPAHPDLRSPRIIVFPENYENVIHKNHTSK
jgi:hypothetical protein